MSLIRRLTKSYIGSTLGGGKRTLTITIAHKGARSVAQDAEIKIIHEE